jgi:hypothetical protein
MTSLFEAPLTLTSNLKKCLSLKNDNKPLATAVMV